MIRAFKSVEDGGDIWLQSISDGKQIKIALSDIVGQARPGNQEVSFSNSGSEVDLSICYNIVQHHRGMMQFEMSAAKGNFVDHLFSRRFAILRGEAMESLDIAIIGAGPGGLACAIKANSLGLSYVLLEKGAQVFQGIIDSYPRGKKVYPTIPKGEDGPFPIEELMPDTSKQPVEEYLIKIQGCLEKHAIKINTAEEFQEIRKGKDGFTVVTRKNTYRVRRVVLAFGSNIPWNSASMARPKQLPGDWRTPKIISGRRPWC